MTPPPRAAVTSVTAALLAFASFIAGCGDPNKSVISTSPMEADVFQIVKFFPAQMWQRRALNDVNPNGFVVTVYLISGKTQKGAFGDGTINVELRVARHDDKGRKTYEPVHAWSLDPDQALPYRVKREAILGWSYMLHLFWPDDADVLGKEVSITLSYERSDGATVRTRPHHNRVPIYDMDAYRAEQQARQQKQASANQKTETAKKEE